MVMKGIGSPRWTTPLSRGTGEGLGVRAIGRALSFVGYCEVKTTVPAFGTLAH
jgi:hypothetical protein